MSSNKCINFMPIPDGEWVLPDGHDVPDGCEVTRVIHLVGPKPEPTRTERVPWHETPGRSLPNGRKISHVTRYAAGATYIYADNHMPIGGDDDTVEVLV